VALAAKHYSVPLVVCTGLYKLSPLYALDQHTFNELRAPQDIMPMDMGAWPLLLLLVLF